jgi:hypothetical protein
MGQSVLDQKNGGCGGYRGNVGLSGGTTARAADRQTLVIGIETEPQRMDPHSSTTWHTFRVLLHVSRKTCVATTRRRRGSSPPSLRAGTSPRPDAGHPGAG